MAKPVERSRLRRAARKASGGAGPAWPGWRWTASPVTALAILGMSAAWLRFHSLRGPFFADDYLFLDRARGASFAAALAARDPLGNYWRPVGRQAWFGLVSALGASPAVAHSLNLAVFLGILALLFVLAHRLAGTRAALVATALVALHEAADVPVLWASGSQDLLAVAGALASACLVLCGRSGWAALPLLCGLLSKETVAVTPFVTLALLRSRGDSWRDGVRRVAPQLGATAAWIVAWVLAMRGATRTGLRVAAESVPAALAHLVQSFLGLQWGDGAPASLARAIPPGVPLLLALVAVALAWGKPPARPQVAAASRAVPLACLAWAALAALPVAPVVQAWSSYYYLFAICGLSVAAGAWLARFRAPAALAAIALVACTSEGVRRTEAFATVPDAWATRSHLNRFYLDRSMRWVSRYLDDLRRQHPALPRRSTLFFAGVPTFSAWQCGDGALVRWVYGDSTLRSYYYGDFTLARARRGPYFMFIAGTNDSLAEETGHVPALVSIASSQMLSEHFGTARDAIDCALAESPREPSLHYWRAWLGLATSDSVAFVRELAAAGCGVRPGPSPEIAIADRRAAAGDPDGASAELQAALEHHALDPEVHARFADILMETSPHSSAGPMEALVTRLLAPGDPASWRRWAKVQVATRHPVEAYGSLARYFAMAGPEARKDPRDVALLEELRQMLPGGRLVQAGLRIAPAAR